MKILRPKHSYARERNTPLFFLAGPIRGGGAWQADACRFLFKVVGECVIACPSRWDENHLLRSHFVGSLDSQYPNQLSWEREYLERAAVMSREGCVIFWLPLESATNPHPGPEPYAMDTRGELGEWRWRMRDSKTRVVVGADPQFLGLSQIQRNFNAALYQKMPIYNSLESTVRAALDESKRTSPRYYA